VQEDPAEDQHKDDTNTTVDVDEAIKDDTGQNIRPIENAHDAQHDTKVCQG